MNDILTYIEWRGDLSFSQSGFNEVDNLIFALLSYFDFRGILPAPGGGGNSRLKERHSSIFRVVMFRPDHQRQVIPAKRCNGCSMRWQTAGVIEN